MNELEELAKIAKEAEKFTFNTAFWGNQKDVSALNELIKKFGTPSRMTFIDDIVEDKPAQPPAPATTTGSATLADGSEVTWELDQRGDAIRVTFRGMPLDNVALGRKPPATEMPVDLGMVVDEKIQIMTYGGTIVCIRPPPSNGARLPSVHRSCDKHASAAFCAHEMRVKTASRATLQHFCGDLC